MLLWLVSLMSLSHSHAIDRTSRLIGFQTARSQWGGYNQSERRTKVSKAPKQTNKPMNWFRSMSQERVAA